MSTATSTSSRWAFRPDDAVETLHLFRSYLLMFAPLLLLVAAGGGYWLSRRALSPVDALVRTAREISGTNLNSRLQKLETGDELQRLSDTLNEMLDRIESAFLRITQFTADASHELRTPVSLIRTEAELALRRSRGEAEYKESLRHILLEAERTTALIEQLLSLARADSGRETLHLAARGFAPDAAHRGRAAGSRWPPFATCNFQRALTFQIFLSWAMRLCCEGWPTSCSTMRSSTLPRPARCTCRWKRKARAR